MIVCFVDIGGIAYHRCLNFFFILLTLLVITYLITNMTKFYYIHVILFYILYFTLLVALCGLQLNKTISCLLHY